MIGVRSDLSAKALDVVAASAQLVILYPDRLSIRLDTNRLWSVLAGRKRPQLALKRAIHSTLKRLVPSLAAAVCSEPCCPLRPTTEDDRIRFLSRPSQEPATGQNNSREMRSPINDRLHRESAWMSANVSRLLPLAFFRLGLPKTSSTAVLRPPLP